MNKYEITEDQINLLISQIAKAPAEFVFNAILSLRSLKKIEEVKDDNNAVGIN